MPNYISKGGVFYPAKEKVALENKSDKPITYDKKKIGPGEPFIYEGPDREALLELHKAGEEKFGQDFRQNTEFLQSVRNQGFNGVDEYLKWIGYDEEKENKDFEEKAESVKSHEIPKKVKAIKELGGGNSPDKKTYGGFGTPEGA